MKLKRKRKNKILFTYFVLNYIYIFIIFLVVYYLVSFFYPTYKIHKSINDDYVYISDLNALDYINLNDLNDAMLYKYEFVEIEGKYIEVIYMNEEGAKNGIPSYNDIYFHKIDLSNLPKNQIITSVKDSDIDLYYYDFNPNISINNNFISFSFNVKYICISDEYIEENGYNYIILKNMPSFLKNYYDINTFNSEGYSYLGKEYKKQQLQIQDSIVKALIFVSIIPLIYAFLSIVNLIKYYLNNNKDIIVINRIYYKKQSEQFWYFLIRIILLTIVSAFLALLSNMIIFNNYNIGNLLFALFVVLIISIFFTIRVIKKVLDSIYKRIEWEVIYD